MKYVVLSTTVWDSILLPGQRESINAIGGAGIYALAGMKVWDDDVGIVTGIGEDYLPQFRHWYEQNGIPTWGLMLKDRFTPHTLIRYDEDGERTETPEFGLEHYQRIEATPKEAAPYLQDADGLYVFKNANPIFWTELLSMRSDYRFRLLWEIGADAATSDQRDTVLAIARQVDMLSINKAEAMTLFGVASLNAALERLCQCGIPMVYLRNGSDGVYIIQGKKTVHVPSVSGVTAVDATGGGNSSTGGALIGLCRGCSLAEIGAMGNVSASFCIMQYGVPPLFDRMLHRTAEQRKQAVLENMR